MTVETVTGVCARHYYHTMIFHTDDFIPPHEHNYSHATQCLRGEGKLWLTDDPDAFIVMKDLQLHDVPPHAPHALWARKGSIFQCVHLLRLEDGTEVPYGYKLTPWDIMKMTSWV